MPDAQVVSIEQRRDHCRAVTTRGRPCRNRVVDGSVFCRLHLPTDQMALPAEFLPERLGRVAVGEVLDLIGRRMRGEYDVDLFGFDRELTEMLLPLLEPLTKYWWRVEVIGNDRLPADGPALLAANHAGAIPLDGLVLRGIVWQRHPHRHLRMLVADLGFTIPFFSHIVRKAGSTMATPEDAHRLLDAGELVAVFPEGYKGVGKGWRNRYRVQRFGRGGFVESAVATGTPIVPVAIVGSEETYPMLADLKPLARLLGLPYLPLTAQSLVLGPLGFLPLPSKWIVEFCEPVPTDDLDPESASDPMVVFDVTDRVRQSIQRALLKNLKLRRTIFS